MNAATQALDVPYIDKQNRRPPPADAVLDGFVCDIVVRVSGHPMEVQRNEFKCSEWHFWLEGSRKTANNNLLDTDYDSWLYRHAGQVALMSFTHIWDGRLFDLTLRNCTCTTYQYDIEYIIRPDLQLDTISQNALNFLARLVGASFVSNPLSNSRRKFITALYANGNSTHNLDNVSAGNEREGVAGKTGSEAV